MMNFTDENTKPVSKTPANDDEINFFPMEEFIVLTLCHYAFKRVATACVVVSFN